MADKHINELQEKTSMGFSYGGITVHDSSEISNEKMKRVSASAYGIPMYNIGTTGNFNIVIMNGITVPVINSGGTIKARVTVKDFLVAIHIDQPRLFTYGIAKSTGGMPSYTLSLYPYASYIEYNTQSDLGVQLLWIKVGYVDESDITHEVMVETYVYITNPLNLVFP